MLPAFAEDPMAQEIQDQPQAVARLLAAMAPDPDGPVRLDAALSCALCQRPNLLWAACGSSFWAATLGAYALSQLCGLGSAVRAAHELVALEPGAFRNIDLCILVSQSGQTADTLEALDLADQHRTPVVAVVGAPDSPMAAQSRWTIDTCAGLERAVPSTKGFTTQSVAGLLLAAHAAGQSRPSAAAALIQALHALPGAWRGQATAGTAFAALAQAASQASQVVFLGRGPDYPIAAEGALKLMESAQLPAQGFAMGEFKHGPMACLDSRTPVVAVVSAGPLVARTRRNLEQLRRCGAPVWWIGPPELGDMAGFDGHHIQVAASHHLVAPLVAVQVLQQLAWQVARLRSRNPSAPRHLVKSIQQL